MPLEKQRFDSNTTQNNKSSDNITIRKINQQKHASSSSPQGRYLQEEINSLMQCLEQKKTNNIQAQLQPNSQQELRNTNSNNHFTQPRSLSPVNERVEKSLSSERQTIDKQKVKIAFTQESGCFSDSGIRPTQKGEFSLNNRGLDTMLTLGNDMRTTKDSFLVEKSFETQKIFRATAGEKIQHLNQEITSIQVKHQLEVAQLREQIVRANHQIVLLSSQNKISDLVEEYEKDITKLLLSNQNLRIQLDYITTIEAKGNGSYEINNLKEMVNKLNKDFMQKEQELNNMKKQNRQQISANFQTKSFLKQIDSLEQLNTELVHQNQLYQDQANGLNDIIENLKIENRELQSQNFQLNQNLSYMQNDVDTYEQMLKMNGNLKAKGKGGSLNDLLFQNQENYSGAENNFGVADVQSQIAKLRNKITQQMELKNEDIEILEQLTLNLTKDYLKKLQKMKTVHQNYVDFLIDLQDKLEKKYGLTDAAVKAANQYIRQFIMEGINEIPC